MRGGETIATYSALNDVVITKIELARMIDLDTHVDNHFVAAYKADGLIISTPTGSTAYSLSAGGPVIFPSVAAFCITPICPHMLTNRPVIVPDTSVIQILNHGEDGTFLTIDGQVGEPLSKGDRVVCRSSSEDHPVDSPAENAFLRCASGKVEMGRTLSVMRISKKISLTSWIFIALVIGILLGIFFPSFAQEPCPDQQHLSAADQVDCRAAALRHAGLRIASAGELKTMGRIAVKSIVYFEVATTLALVIGLVVVNLIKPGAG